MKLTIKETLELLKEYKELEKQEAECDSKAKSLILEAQMSEIYAKLAAVEVNVKYTLVQTVKESIDSTLAELLEFIDDDEIDATIFNRCFKNPEYAEEYSEPIKTEVTFEPIRYVDDNTELQ